MEATWEKARELGRLLGQSEEYKALKRAKERVSNEREIVTMLTRLGELEQEIGRALQSGEEPAPNTADEYEQIFSAVQVASGVPGIGGRADQLRQDPRSSER